MGNNNFNNKKRRPIPICKEAASIGIVLIIFGAVTVCAFILPPKAWIMLLGVVLVICGIVLLNC
ncbi:MAG: hypothetical protein PUB87_07020 [Eubacteriaceae bacterium]|nr:hypothetical protein [Eubacteriaceae bacterium]